MKHYRSELLLSAPASTVFQALTTPKGLKGWWTTTCEIGTAVGEQSTFRFGQTYKVMQIERLEPNSEVRWQCVGAHIHMPGVLTKTQEWVGTTIVFHLIPKSESSTLLQFDHVGLTPEIECFAICTAGWNQFLASLKSYVESGAGTPYAEPAA